MATPERFPRLIDLDGSADDDSFDNLDEYFEPRDGYVDLETKSLNDGRLDHDDGSQPPDASLILKVSKYHLDLKTVLINFTSSLIAKRMRFQATCATGSSATLAASLIALAVE
jgi:hypothetical protein